MKKVGILTHYHDSVNYGGALQAYALCRAVKSLGYDCEQIDIDCFKECRDLDYEPPFIKRVLRPVLPLLKRVCRMAKKRRTAEKAALRARWRASFADFVKNDIPHTDRQYFKKTVAETVGDYDAFIVGSDQVWNPIWYFEPFFLDFVPDEIPKIAYAASISQVRLSDKAKKTYSAHLSRFSAISVREAAAVSLLSDLVSAPVMHVLDPTLLLDASQWEEIAAERVVALPYVFCYFLGNDRGMREAAAAFARSRGLTLVNIPHATAHYHTEDEDFGDVQKQTPTPSEFLSLIKYAEYVFTDSFHAVIFSSVFQRQFFVFERQNYAEMSTRTESFMHLLCADERFCKTEEMQTVEHLSSLSDIRYSACRETLSQMKKASLAFLENALRDMK